MGWSLREEGEWAVSYNILSVKQSETEASQISEWLQRRDPFVIPNWAYQFGLKSATDGPEDTQSPFSGPSDSPRGDK